MVLLFLLLLLIAVHNGREFGSARKCRGGCNARATRPWRPADVSSLPRSYVAYGPPLNGNAHGRKVLHAFRPTRTFEPVIAVVAAQKFRHPPLVGHTNAPRRPVSGVARAPFATTTIRRVGEEWVYGAAGGLKFRNGFSSSKPPPLLSRPLSPLRRPPPPPPPSPPLPSSSSLRPSSPSHSSTI